MTPGSLGTKPVFLAGGGSGIGLKIVELLSGMGTPVRVLVRREEAFTELSAMPGVTPIMGDAADEKAVQGAMTGCVAAITTLGGRLPDGRLIDYVGNSCVVEQAGILGCERIVLITSIGCGETKSALAPATYKVLQENLEEKDKAERDLRMYTNLDWTSLRPGGLTNDAPTGKAVVTESVSASGTVSRADVAQIVIDILKSDTRSTRKELSCVDPSLVRANSEVPIYTAYAL
jgi:uncharacterized protein YbjT (DUF2867 family)